MKWLTRLLSRFCNRYIAVWEEQLDPYAPQQPAADVNVLRSSVGRYFTYNKPGLVYILLYETIYDNAIDGIRADGWAVQLEADASGQLFYAIFNKSGEEAPRFYIQ